MYNSLIKPAYKLTVAERDYQKLLLETGFSFPPVHQHALPPGSKSRGRLAKTTQAQIPPQLYLYQK